MILKGANNGDEPWPWTKDEFIVNNPKATLLGGYEAPALAAIWGLMLLDSHPDWQARSRSEVLDVCEGRKLLQYNMISKTKVVCTCFDINPY